VLNLIGSKISYFSILYDLICEGTAVPNVSIVLLEKEIFQMI